jgi:hypothetical protein
MFEIKLMETPTDETPPPTTQIFRNFCLFQNEGGPGTATQQNY